MFLLEIFVIMFGKICFSHPIEAIRGCNMNCLKVGAQVGRQSWVVRLTIFRKIRLWRFLKIRA